MRSNFTIVLHFWIFPGIDMDHERLSREELMIVGMMLKKDSHGHSDGFFRADIRPEKVHLTRVSFASIEKNSK